METIQDRSTIRAAEQVAVQCQAIDDIRIGALETARPLGELDSRVTTLGLLAITLIFFCLVDNKPHEIEILGFKMEVISWKVVAGALALMVVYMQVHVLSLWWHENEVWNLKGKPALVTARDHLQSLLADARELVVDSHVAALGMIPRTIVAETFEYPHERFNAAPIEVVESWLRMTIDTERTKLRAAGYFRVFSEEHWNRQMEICSNTEVHRARLLACLYDTTSDEDIVGQISALEARKHQQLRALGPMPIAAPEHTMDVGTRAVVSAYAEKAAKSVRLMIGLARLRSLMMLWFPAALSAASMVTFGVALYRNVHL
jgi:hypothetical protein